MSLGGSVWDSEFKKVDDLLSHGTKLINTHFTDGEEKANLKEQMDQCYTRMNKIAKDRAKHAMAINKVKDQLQSAANDKQNAIDVQKVILV